MKDFYRKITEFVISLTFNIHKSTLIYTSVFIQYFKAKEGEAYNG